jgi:methionine-rich copper-binding protein CopC
MRRLITLATAAALLVPASTARAHVELDSVSPRKTRHSAVREVHATFKSSLVTGTITIKRSNGSVVALKSNGLKSSNKRILQAVPRSPLGSGRYTVSWRARAPDGHSLSGSWRFRVQR